MKTLLIFFCDECPNYFHCDIREEKENEPIPDNCPIEDGKEMEV